MHRKIGFTLLALGLFMLAAFFTERWWDRWVHPWIFTKEGYYLEGPFSGIFARMLIHVKDWLMYGWFWGPVLIISGSGLVLTKPTGIAWCDKSRYSLMTIVVGACCTGQVVAMTLPLFSFPPGTAVRPMLWALAMFAMAGMALLVGLAFTIEAIIEDQRRWPLVLGILLCLAPLPTGKWLFQLTGLIMKN